MFAESVARRATLPGVSGKPAVPVRYRTIEYSAVIANAGTPDSFTAFVLVSRTMTIQLPSAASSLPGTPQGVLDQLMSQLRTFAGPHPPSKAARAAAWRVLAALPGLRLCGNGSDLAGRCGLGLCADSSGEPSRMYPMVPGGRMLSSATFLSP
jgi:hypothetical protein